MKLEKRSIGSNQNKYNNDDTVGMDYADSPFKTVAAIAGTIALARFAYKSGVFKKGISEAIDYASKYKAAYPGAVSVFKAWMNAGEDIVKDRGVEQSLIRAIKGVNVTSPFTKEGRKTIVNNFKVFSKDNLEETLNSTKRDFGFLKESVVKKFKDFNTIHDTEFSKLYASINRTTDQAGLDGVRHGAAKTGKRQMIKDMIAKLTESNEKVSANLKNSGHNALQLKDIFDLVGKTEKTGKGKPFKLVTNNLNVKMDKKTVDYLEKFGMEAIEVDKKGKVTKRAYEHSDFMNMRLDSFILANESKKMVDMRGFKNTFKFFTDSISNDFKIPILGINPFKIFGVDNFGKDKMVFGVLRKGTKQASLLNKTGEESVLNNTMFFSNGSVYRYNENGGVDLVKKNMHILKVYNGEKGASHVNKELNSITKIFNMDTRPKNLYTKDDGKIKYYYGKFMKKLDIGFNDIDIADNFGEMGVNEYLNPNTYIQKVTNWLLKDSKLRPFKNNTTAKSIKFNELFATGLKKDDDIFIAANNMVGFKDTFNAFREGDGTTVKSFFKQFIAGRNNPDNVTTATTSTFFLFDRVNSTLNMAGLGLSKESLSSTPAIIKNMFLKRVLPMYLGYNAYEFVNYLSEGKPDENDNRDNITKKIARGVGTVDLGYHKIKDTLGLTDVAKSFASVMPGIDQIGDLPGLNLLKLDKTYDDRVNDFNTGMEPVRKGRYWEMGVSPFTGGRIEFYQPTLMRRIQADTKFSDVMYGSRAEYFRNSPLPTPLNPIAPLTYLMGGQYHYELEHYKDRPYLETGGMFNDIPIAGQILNSTIGKILKPTIHMHQEDLKNAQMYMAQSNFLTPSQGTGFIGKGNTPTVYNGDAMFSPMAYMAPSGRLNLVGVPSLPRYSKLNSDLQKMSLKQSTQVLDNLDRMLQPSTGNESIKDQIDAASSQNSLGYGLGALYNNTTDFLGLYGFFGRSVTGRANNGKVIDNSGYAFSASRQFWDSNLGGLGGEISEIFRRFMYKDPDSGDLINPIRNTMATWLPSSNYFQNFQVGDAFKKIQRGEFRLPGQAFERMWGLENPLKLKIGSSFIGKDKQSIIKHFFKQDEITDPNSQSIVDDGNTLHKSIEGRWKRSGFAIDTEVEINDAVHNILGFYDARVHDNTAPGGEAIVDIKTVNAKKFQELASNKGFKEENMKQVNYYLYATGLKKGYLYYVNRDNPEQTYTYGFDYSPQVLEKTLKTLQSARSETLGMINSGVASRGDLYEPIDRLRILGDVAPYSEEYSNMVTYMSKLNLSDEDKKEVAAIKARVSAVKNPMRLYDYQYKTSNLKYMDVTVDKVVDKETFFIKGVNTPVKLGGINIKELDSQYDNDKMHNILNKYIYDGAHIKLGVDANASERVKSGSIRAVVYSGGKNINKLLLDNKYAEANDWKDPVSINAQVSSGARAFGKLWETLAHLDTPVNTKFINVRSAREKYERDYVYGKTYSSWSRPIHDYFKPFVVNRNVHKSLLGGLAWGALIGSMFGKTKFGMFVGTAIGLGSVAVGKVHAALYETMHHTMWKPKEVRKKEEINEYMDMLKYVKYKRLFYKYNELAKKDGINVLALIRGKIGEGNDIKARVKYLESLKRKIKRDDNIMDKSGALAFRTKYGSNSLFFERANTFVDAFKAYISDKLNYLGSKPYTDYSNVEKGRGKREYLKDSNYIKGLKNILGGSDDERAQQLHAINKEIDELKQNRKLIPFQNRSNGNALKLMIKSQYLNQMLESLNGPMTDEEIREQIKDNRPKYYSLKKNINRDQLKQALVRELNEIAEHSNVNQNAVKAMLYYQMSEKTMYAYQPGVPVANITAALPKSDRDFYRSFVDAPEEERLKILKMAPRYLRRPLESAWGLKVEDKANIVNYFSQRALPDENWAGWNEDINLDSVKVKMVKKEDLSFGDNNIWKDDVAMANTMGRIPIPKLNVQSSSYRTREELKRTLTQVGFRDLRINLGLTNNSNNIDLDMSFDDTKKYKQQLADKADESLTR